MNKARIAIVYYSNTGTTEAVAKAVARGVEQSGLGFTDLLAIENSDFDYCRFTNQIILQRLTSADAIAFGSPTYMGGVAAQFKSFADATSPIWSDGLWRNKYAAGFTVGSNIRGDMDKALHYLLVLARQHGMLWIEPKYLNHFGTSAGCIALNSVGKVEPDDLEAARALGRRVSMITSQPGLEGELA